MTNLEDIQFACEGATSIPNACKGEAFFGEHGGKCYCVLHYPATDKEEAFDSAVRRKLESKDFNFEGVWFPDLRWFSNINIDESVNFSYSIFNERASFYKTVFRADVSFASAIFNESSSFEHTTFVEKVTFNSARFHKDVNFRNARFEAYADFWRCTFNGMAEFGYAKILQTASFWPAIFDSTASFSHASFVRANFRASEFKEKAVFSWCAFGFAEFIDASFSNEADFFDARFEGMANFARAKFDASARLTMSEFSGEARFISATFNAETDFSHTVFKDIVSFSAEYGIGGFGKNAACDFRHALFETPKRVSFHSITLRPYWFVNIDPREFQFIDVKWIGNLGREYIEIEIGELRKREEREEKVAADKRAEWLRNAEQYDDKFTIERLQREEQEERATRTNAPDKKRTPLYRLLSITCRQLAVNAEESHRYDEASDFRFWSMELRRREGLKARGRVSIGILHVLYRYLSGYGEEIGRAFGILLGIWLLFAFLYIQVGFVRSGPSTPETATYKTDEFGSPQKMGKALAYSLEIITLQRPDPQPLTLTARFAVLAERILGPLQVTLFALAVRRRFMR
jgi:uncharacterized protein YjbI with pentapeptide repeats